MTALNAVLCAPSGNDAGPAYGQHAADILGVLEQELLERLCNSDEKAFEIMYKAFHPRMVAIATAYVDQSTAEEIAQDVLLYVWERRETWAPQHGIAVYMYASTRNRALKQLRHQGVIARLEHVARAQAEERSPARTPYDAVEHDDLMEKVNSAMSHLPELGRTAFMLRWVHQLGYAEISRIMGLSEVAVRKQVSRAREALIKTLKDA